MILIVDIAVLYAAAWATSGESPIDAMTGALQRVTTVVERFAPSRLLVAADGKNSRQYRQILSPEYKSLRPSKPPGYGEGWQMLLSRLRKREQRQGGLPMALYDWDGWEGDDIIATLVSDTPDDDVVIVSEDKDLAQLVSDRVVLYRPRHDDVLDAAAVKETFGVEPSRLQEFLSLTGDTSDGIRGCPGVGPVTAVAVLQHGHLSDIMEAGPAKMSDQKLAHKLWDEDGRPRWDWTTALALVQLRVDRQMLTPAPEPAPAAEEAWDDQAQVGPAPAPAAEEAWDDQTQVGPAPHVVLADPLHVQSPRQTVGYSLQLEPRDPEEAWRMAETIAASGLYPSITSPEQAMVLISHGRTIGMTAVQAISRIHVISGRPSLSAEAIVSLVLQSGLADYFACASSDNEQCTWRTRRKGSDTEQSETYSLSDARTAGLLEGKQGAQWRRRPRTMLRWRAATELARYVYPDALGGSYSIEEMRDA